MNVVHLRCMCAFTFRLLWNKRLWELGVVHLIGVRLGVVEREVRR